MDQNIQSSHSSQTAALRINTAPPSNKGNSSSSHGAHGARLDARSSAKFQGTPGSPPQTNAHVTASRANTAPVPSKNFTYYVPHGVANPPLNPPSPPPPSKPPKPDELKQEMSTYMAPSLTRRNPDPNREGSYSHPPPSLSMAQVTTGPGESPSPRPSGPRGVTIYHSPQIGSPDAWNRDYSSPHYPEPQLSPPHNTAPFAYPSPKVSPQEKGPHRGGSIRKKGFGPRQT